MTKPLFKMGILGAIIKEYLTDVMVFQLFVTLVILILGFYPVGRTH